MKKILLTLLTAVCTLSVAAKQYVNDKIYVYLNNATVDSIEIDGAYSVNHSCLDLKNVKHDDFVTVRITSGIHEYKYLLSTVKRIELPKGEAVEMVSATGSANPKVQTRAINGIFPQQNGKVNFLWDTDDQVYIGEGTHAGAKPQMKGAKHAKSAGFEFAFTKGETHEENYNVYYPGNGWYKKMAKGRNKPKPATVFNKVLIKSVQTQSTANNTDHFSESGDCATGIAKQQFKNDPNGDVKEYYNFSMDHRASYLCFLPHTTSLRSVRLKKVTVSSLNTPLVGTFDFDMHNGLTGGGNTTDTVATLICDENGSFFLGPNYKDGTTSLQESVASFMVVKPQLNGPVTLNCAFELYDTLSRIDTTIYKTYVWNEGLQENTFYTMGANIPDSVFEWIDMGTSVMWSNHNAGTLKPNEQGNSIDYAESNTGTGIIIEGGTGSKREGTEPSRTDVDELVDHSTAREMTYAGTRGVVITSTTTGQRIFVAYEGYVDDDPNDPYITLWTKTNTDEYGNELKDEEGDAMAYIIDFDAENGKLRIVETYVVETHPVREVLAPSATTGGNNFKRGAESVTINGSINNVLKSSEYGFLISSDKAKVDAGFTGDANHRSSFANAYAAERNGANISLNISNYDPENMEEFYYRAYVTAGSRIYYGETKTFGENVSKKLYGNAGGFKVSDRTFGDDPDMDYADSIADVWQTNDKVYVRHYDKGEGTKTFTGSLKDLYEFHFPHDTIFDLDGWISDPSYTVYYPGQNATVDTYNKVTIPSQQHQVTANSIADMKAYGDCGIGTAVRGVDGKYRFQLDHKAAYLSFIPYVDIDIDSIGISGTNVKIKKVMVKNVGATALSGTCDLTPNYGLVTSGMNEIITLNCGETKTGFDGKETTAGWRLPNSPQVTGASAIGYMAVIPQNTTTTINVTFVVDYFNGLTNSVTRKIKIPHLNAGEIYPITCHITGDDLKAVDMGTGDGVKWGIRNLETYETVDQTREDVDMTSPVDEGGQYLWGATVDYNSMSYAAVRSSYSKWSPDSKQHRSNAYYSTSYWNEILPMLKYSSTNPAGYWTGNINTTNGHDIAHTKWGGNWRMPTSDEALALTENRNVYEATINGVPGRVSVSKVNGNSFFIADHASINERGLENQTQKYSWSSEMVTQMTGNDYWNTGNYAKSTSNGYPYYATYRGYASGGEYSTTWGCTPHPIRPIYKE